MAGDAEGKIEQRVDGGRVVETFGLQPETGGHGHG